MITRDYALLFARLVIGAIFLTHSLPKLTSTAQLATGMGMSVPFVLAIGIVEIVSALALVSGIYTKYATLALSGVMLGAIYMKYIVWGIGFTSMQATGWEFDLMILAANLLVYAHGAGSLTLIKPAKA